ncbi:MAG: hypothetical protein KDC38_03555 [Planctomycetes bacterium]|nr:hypothetical protein [Planctomycetota bacterium]
MIADANPVVAELSMKPSLSVYIRHGLANLAKQHQQRAKSPASRRIERESARRWLRLAVEESPFAEDSHVVDSGETGVAQGRIDTRFLLESRFGFAPLGAAYEDGALEYGVVAEQLGHRSTVDDLESVVPLIRIREGRGFPRARLSRIDRRGRFRPSLESHPLDGEGAYEVAVLADELVEELAAVLLCGMSESCAKLGEHTFRTSSWF